MNETIEDCSLAEELSIDTEERERMVVTDLLSFQRGEGSQSIFGVQRWPF